MSLDESQKPLIDPSSDKQSTAQLFDQAVRDHSRRLLAIARAIVGYRASPEDVVQQAFMNLYQHRERYDWREPGGLLRRTVVNEALRILRQPKMTALVEDAAGPIETHARPFDAVGSSASRSPSPMKFAVNAMRMMNRPGK